MGNPVWVLAVGMALCLRVWAEQAPAPPQKTPEELEKGRLTAAFEKALAVSEIAKASPFFVSKSPELNADFSQHLNFYARSFKRAAVYPLIETANFSTVLPTNKESLNAALAALEKDFGKVQPFRIDYSSKPLNLTVVLFVGQAKSGEIAGFYLPMLLGKNFAPEEYVGKGIYTTATMENESMSRRHSARAVMHEFEKMGFETNLRAVGDPSERHLGYETHVYQARSNGFRMIAEEWESLEPSLLVISRNVKADVHGVFKYRGFTVYPDSSPRPSGRDLCFGGNSSLSPGRPRQVNAEDIRKSFLATARLTTLGFREEISFFIEEAYLEGPSAHFDLLLDSLPDIRDFVQKTLWKHSDWRNLKKEDAHMMIGPSANGLAYIDLRAANFKQMIAAIKAHNLEEFDRLYKEYDRDRFLKSERSYQYSELFYIPDHVGLYRRSASNDGYVYWWNETKDGQKTVAGIRESELTAHIDDKFRSLNPVPSADIQAKLRRYRDALKKR